MFPKIKKPAALCLEHMTTRDQAGDSGVSLGYLEQLEENYDELIDTIQYTGVVPLVYEVDGSGTVKETVKAVDDLLVQFMAARFQLYPSVKMTQAAWSLAAGWA